MVKLHCLFCLNRSCLKSVLLISGLHQIIRNKSMTPLPKLRSYSAYHKQNQMSSRERKRTRQGSFIGRLHLMCSWIQFQSLSNRNCTSLDQHLKGRAKKVVEQLQFQIGDPERACTKARKRLKERFGHSAILSAEFEVKLTNCSKVGNSDARGMQESSYFLQQVENASEYIPNLKIFEFSSKLQILVDNIPGWFKAKWSTKVQRLQQSQGHNAFPSFSEFVREVTFHSERMNIPQITQIPVINSNHKSTTITLTPLPRK